MVSALLILACFATQERGKLIAPRLLPVHGTLHKGTMYGLFGEQRDDTTIDAVPVVNTPNRRSYGYLSGDLAKPFLETPKPGWKLYIIWPPPWGYECRHKIKYESIWVATGHLDLSRLKFDELYLFDTSNRDSVTQYARRNGTNRDSHLEFHQIDVPTMTKKYRNSHFETQGSGGPGSIARNVLGFGSVPISENICKCYMLIKPKGDKDTKAKLYIEIWETHFRWNEKTDRWKTIEDGKNLECFESHFAEDFYLFTEKDCYYFLTQSGKLYIAPAPKAGEKSRTMKALWDDAKRPIVAVIEDADNDKVWLFAKDKNAGAKRDLYFEMKDTIRPESFDPAKLRPVNVEGRAKMLLEYLPLISKNEKPR